MLGDMGSSVFSPSIAPVAPTVTDPVDVLVIDDSEDDRDLYARLLKPGVQVQTVDFASDGEEGLARYHDRPTDCVLLDFNMPGDDGLAVLERLKAIDPHVAVVMMTGEGNENIAVAAMKAGAMDYVVKDRITASVLLRAIVNATEKAALVRKIAAQHEEQVNFIRILVHDVRAPLRGLTGFSDMLAEDLEAGTYEDVPDHLDMIKLSATRLNALVDTLAHYALLDGKMAHEKVDMNDVVIQALDNLRLVIDERHAQVDVAILPCATGSGPELAQLLQNLIGNGIKYNDRVAPTITISVKSDGDEQIFVVEDNGIGIPEAKLTAIFRPFERLWSRDVYEGTGLGLAICRKIIERHDGRIWCESEVGSGSRFCFTLPAV
ncbi:MAG: ATP-binding protein [Pseudomonadota bacterium]